MKFEETLLRGTLADIYRMQMLIVNMLEVGYRMPRIPPY